MTEFYSGKAFKEFKPLSMRNHSLLLNLATDNDEGYYMCQATNEIGAGLKKVIRINVNGNIIELNSYIS